MRQPAIRRSARSAIVGLLVAMPVISERMPAAAQGFPTRQITIVVPFAPGGPSDTMARLIADGMAGQTGSRVLVENVAGAGGTTGSARVAKAEPDGHTLVFGNIGTHAANVGLYKKLPYDPVADFEPVALIASVPLVMSVKLSHPAKTFDEFKAMTTSQPGAFTYGSAGIGSASHLGCLLLDAALSAKARHVPYRGAGPALNDLVAGQIDFMCDQTVTMMPQVTGGTIRPLATLSAKRLAALSAVPTVSEKQVSGVEVEVWNALFSPKGTSTSIVAQLVSLVQKAQADPALAKRFAELGAALPSTEGGGPAALKTQVASEVARWSASLKAAGVEPQ